MHIMQAPMAFQIIYEDNHILAIDKQPGIVVYREGEGSESTLIETVIERHPAVKLAGEMPRYGMVHRLDKDTSGILLIAKDSKTLAFLQQQFMAGSVQKIYLALVAGSVVSGTGTIDTLIGRAGSDKTKQKVYLPHEPNAHGKRKALTEYEVIERFTEYTLVKAYPKTGRKHQIRCHFAHIGHPIAGDLVYGFKNQPRPKGLTRQFLHASRLRIQLPDNTTKEFNSELPKDLKKVLESLKIGN